MTGRKPRGRSSKKIELGQMGAVVGGVGTLLAGVAAVVALAVNQPSPPPSQSATATATQSAPHSSPSTEPTSLRAATGFADLADVVGAFAAERLGSDGSSEYEFITHVDETGLLSVVSPAEWTDVELTTWLDDNDMAVGPAILASTDVDRLYSGWDTAGVFVGAAQEGVDPDEMLDAREEVRRSACQEAGRYSFSGDGHDGRYVVWTDCGGGDTIILDLVTNTEESGATLLAHVRLTETADVRALVRLLRTVRLNETELSDNQRYFPGQLIP